MTQLTWVIVALILLAALRYFVNKYRDYKSRYFIFKSTGGTYSFVSNNDMSILIETGFFVKTCATKEEAIIEVENLNKNN